MILLDKDYALGKAENQYYLGYIDEHTKNAIIKFLNLLPSAQPERKTGKWIHEFVNTYTEKTYCSECGKSAPFVFVSDDYYGVHAHGEDRKTNFCPNCGADMRDKEGAQE